MRKWFFLLLLNYSFCIYVFMNMIVVFVIDGYNSPEVSCESAG